MNALTKLTALALTAAGIAGGVAVAQTTSPATDEDGRAQTANYGTPPGAPLKRDGSLSADPTPAPAAAKTMGAPAADTSATAPAADMSSPAPMADTAAVDNTSPPADAPAPRADRN